MDSRRFSHMDENGIAEPTDNDEISDDEFDVDFHEPSIRSCQRPRRGIASVP